MVRAFKTAGVRLTFKAAPSIELDGELRRAQSRDIQIACVPRALRVIAAPGASL
jgi:diacylglycerol kinase family enzyme